MIRADILRLLSVYEAQTLEASEMMRGAQTRQAAAIAQAAAAKHDAEVWEKLRDFRQAQIEFWREKARNARDEPPCSA